MNKDISISINNPLTLGLKYLLTDDVSRASANETAILLRAKKPATATIPAILKNDKLLDWDHILILASIKKMLQHQVDALKARKKDKLAQKLDNDKKDLMCLLIDDTLLSTPKSIHATFNALFTKDHHFTRILDVYSSRRGEIIAQPENRQRSIARMTGYCIGYNFKSECDNNPCAYLHNCLLHNEPQQHKTMLCTDNISRWRKSTNKSGDNRSNRRRPRNRNKLYNYHQNQRNIPPNMAIMPPQQYVQNQPVLQYHPQPIYPPQPMWDKKGNKDRYNIIPPKK